MRYEKPKVIDLSAGARSIAGQEPLGCWPGSTYINGTACMTGDSNWSCASGTTPTGYQTCVGGTTVGSSGLCVLGTDPVGSDLCTTGPGPL